jgi:hypothetical protein
MMGLLFTLSLGLCVFHFRKYCCPIALCYPDRLFIQTTVYPDLISSSIADIFWFDFRGVVNLGHSETIAEHIPVK